MGTGWRILDLTGMSGEFDVDGGMLVISTESGVVDAVPAADVAVVLLGVGVRFTSGVLYRLAEHDVVMLTCDWKGVPYAVTSPWSDHSRISERQIAQARASSERTARAWQEVVRAKLRGQAATLRQVRPRFAPYLEDLAQRVEPGDLGNCEAVGARHYFTRLFGAAFVRDHDGGDRRNALLNYGYGILRAQGIRAVLGAGLVPTLGIAHSHRSNPFNLVADLMEPFRPAMDAAVLNLPPYSSLKKPETKRRLVEAMQVTFGESGRSVVAELTSLAQRYGRYVEGETEEFTVNAWTGWGGAGG